LENGSAVVKVEELVYAKHGLTPVRWVLATPEASKIKSVKDLKGKLIATELVNVTRKFLKEKRVKAKVEFSWGATEVKVGAGLVDAIVELTETGSSLKANNLRIVETVCYSTTQLIASKAAWADSWKRQKIENLALMLKGAINSEGKVGLKLNVAEKDLQKVINLLPALKKPTISHLYDGARKNGWLAVETILNGDEVKRLIPRLKRANAQGIIEYPLNKVIY
jgi:ATP phosphoribosyltransferase